jgi:peroxiredoxin
MPKISFALILLVTTLFACSAKKEKQEKASVSTINEYPNLLLTLANGKQVSARNLEGKNIFVLFQPECDHCQEEAVHIEQRLEEFKDYTLYFISSSPMDQITAFARNFNLDNRNNVTFAWTSTEGVLNHYGPIPTPSVYIYSNGKLLNSFKGQTDIENIIGAL